MFDFHEKRKIRGLLYSKPVIGLLFVVAILLSVSAYNRWEIARETEVKLEAKQRELQALSERAATLGAKVHYLEDERGVEEELRSRFDVAKEGEDVVVLIDDPAATDTANRLIEPEEAP
jgi:cell division protein FtsB